MVSRVRARTGGQNSAVYEVHTAEPARRLIIKSYPPELTWKLRKEIHVYGLLAGVPLSTVSGELEPAQLHRIYHRLGRLLRRIHGVTPEGFGYIGTRADRPAAHQRPSTWPAGSTTS